MYEYTFCRWIGCPFRRLSMYPNVWCLTLHASFGFSLVACGLEPMRRCRAYLPWDRPESTRKMQRMRRGQTLPSVAVAFMQQLAGNGLSQAEVIFFPELFHAAHSRLPRTFGLTLPLGKQRNSRVYELVHRPHNSALNGVLNRLLLFARELDGHVLDSNKRSLKALLVAVKPLFSRRPTRMEHGALSVISA